MLFQVSDLICAPTIRAHRCCGPRNKSILDSWGHYWSLLRNLCMYTIDAQGPAGVVAPGPRGDFSL